MKCLFCNIIHGELPATLLLDEDGLLAFRDIKPQAPTHFLIIPKKHIATLDDASTEDQQLLGNMFLAAKKLAKQEGLSEAGYRLVLNVNSGGGQEVYHIHLHVLGGRQMTWPPG